MIKQTKTKIWLILGAAATLIFSCGSAQRLAQNSFTPIADSMVYQQALNTAKDFNNLKISHKLTGINPGNHAIDMQNTDTFKVLVIAWKDSADLKYYNNGKPGYFNTGRFINFVTVEPDLQIWYRKNKTDSTTLDMRLKELLGLPPNVNKNCWIEFWVNAKDLYRPCKDNNIDDNACGVDFPANADSSYIKWWNDYHTNSYNNPNLYSNYPFSGLGYTYDWFPRNKTHIGLSEFCINKNATIYVKGYAATYAYFKE